jgi:hypothetical protein
VLVSPDEPTPAPVASSTLDDRGRRTELLEKFGLITESDLATLWGVSVKTLRNKPLVDLPEFVNMGRARLFYVESVGRVMRNSVKPARGRRNRT